MATNKDNPDSKLLYGELSYKLNRVLFDVHNQLGQFARERQYGDLLAEFLTLAGISFNRECRVGDTGNIIDFMIEDVIILELKAKPFLLQTDYEQAKRYLDICGVELAILVNFRPRFIQPKRILRRHL